MYHLLLNTNIFVSLPNDAFCQLVGLPITELQPHTLGLMSAKADVKPQAENKPAEEDRKRLKRKRVENVALNSLTTDVAPKPNAKHLNGKSNGRKSVLSFFLLYSKVRLVLVTDDVLSISRSPECGSCTHVL
jgi:hypothetical protein